MSQDDRYAMTDNCIATTGVTRQANLVRDALQFVGLQLEDSAVQHRRVVGELRRCGRPNVLTAFCARARVSLGFLSLSLFFFFFFVRRGRVTITTEETLDAAIVLEPFQQG